MAVVAANRRLEVVFDEGTGIVSVRRRQTGQAFIRSLTFPPGEPQPRAGRSHHPVFGESETFTVRNAAGDELCLLLPGELEFVLLRPLVRNAREREKVIERVRAFRAVLDLPAPAERLKAFGTAGLTAPDDHPGSYTYLAIADPDSRSGVVAGWLTHERGYGVLFSDVEDAGVDGAGVEEARVGKGVVAVEGWIDYGRLRLAPGASEELETLAIGYFDDARLGLEAYADLVAEVHKVKLPPQPAGYCTWYSDLYKGASDEVHLRKLAAFAAEHLRPYGLDFIQIDDGWQKGERRNGPAKDFTGHNPAGPYPGGMKAAADAIAARGFTPGIWIIPFAADHEDPAFAERPDWFVRRATGEPYETQWGGTCLDMTHPEARRYVAEVVRRITAEWGYKYLKLDALWTGSATEQVYENEGYRDDGIGDAVFHDPAATNMEALRSGLRLVRQAAGEGVFLLGCCAPQNMRSFGGAFGLVDAMRVGPDNASTWPALTRGPRFGTRTYFLHGRVWYNDPDPVYVRARMPLEHARLICTWAAVSGQLTVNSDWLPALPQNRLDILRRVLPSHGLLPRPVDLFERDLPRIWLLSDPRMTGRHVVGVFNWDSKRLDLEYPLERIGLPAGETFAAFDFWENALLPPIKGTLRLTVPKESCRILSVRPLGETPRVISTSRHVTQGTVDVLEESWDDAAGVLRGKSRVVGGDPYEIRIVARDTHRAWEVAEVRAKSAVTRSPVNAEIRASVERGDGFGQATLWRVTLHARESGDVEWAVKFR